MSPYTAHALKRHSAAGDHDKHNMIRRKTSLQWFRSRSRFFFTGLELHSAVRLLCIGQQTDARRLQNVGSDRWSRWKYQNKRLSACERRFRWRRGFAPSGMHLNISVTLAVSVVTLPDTPTFGHSVIWYAAGAEACTKPKLRSTAFATVWWSFSTAILSACCSWHPSTCSPSSTAAERPSADSFYAPAYSRCRGKCQASAVCSQP